MKNVTLIILLFCGVRIFSQQDVFQKLKEELKNEHPEINFENKLIVLNVWSVNDINSREANVQVNKACIAYEFAKLKGGLKGVIGVIFCKNRDQKTETIILNKDKVTKPIILKNISDQDLSNISNVIFDSNGNIVSKNITSDIFEEIHKLITR